MSKRIVLGVLIANRAACATEFQKIITEYGCSIKTRIGLHGVSDNACSPSGLVLLEMFGDEAPILELESKLKAVDCFRVQKMVFEE
jgi:hypothetical protein